MHICQALGEANAAAEALLLEEIEEEKDEAAKLRRQSRSSSKRTKKKKTKNKRGKKGAKKAEAQRPVFLLAENYHLPLASSYLFFVCEGYLFSL